ncbi:CHAT domain-containing protein [Planktothrix mougeotii]|uniref:CHAT domain-containing protein n=1 Tax=Planktothrix mougeotii LEGE 06226 TaxID=1828728 RepID=A0ABR9UJM5_9CYAN|nr:CHAT domain-containing protein [Planktothrix mougeotii]MBE9146673.1 CHAT domain-containing protein [Planktothrix mougeotii LEGE 06226]
MLVKIVFYGDFETGFLVVVDILKDERLIQGICGKLPPAPEILDIFKTWQCLYQKFQNYRFVRLEKKETQTNFSSHEIDESAKHLEKELNKWLKSESFIIVRDTLFSNFNKSSEIRIIIQSDNIHIKQIPWYLWDIFTYYSNAEIAFAPLQYQIISGNQTYNNKKHKVSILAILGSVDHINTEKERQFLETFTPDAEVTFLVEHTRQTINQSLFEKQWDILFFAGHSESDQDKNTGTIYINPTDKIAISKLKYALQKAIETGLKLAIFNSCDGLGLANELSQLNIPQIIVMREPVPDQVAQEFLNYFLTAYSGGKSLYLSLREAREKLQSLEHIYPCASWLPVLFQNPAVNPPSWNDLLG